MFALHVESCVSCVLNLQLVEVLGGRARTNEDNLFETTLWLWLGCEVSSAFFLVPESWRKLGRQKSVGRKIAANFSRFVAQIDRRKATEKVRANGKMSDIFTFIIA